MEIEREKSVAKEYPEWVKKHKNKNVELRKIHNQYYAYAIKSKWDKDKKISKKRTGKYIGKITPEGIIPAKHNREKKINSILEYGNIKIVHFFSKEIEKLLKEYFPKNYETIIAAAMIRLIYTCPLKNFLINYEESYLQKIYPKAHLTKNQITNFLQEIGRDYNTLILFFRELSKNRKHLAIDLTQIFSESENIKWLEKGYNSDNKYANQLQFLLTYDLEKNVPTFFKILPGSIKDVSSLRNAIYETKITNIILVADRGFYSESNIKELEDSGIHYIFPARRNLNFIQYEEEKTYTKYFSFRDRYIWFKEYTHNERRILSFLDKKLRNEEEITFLQLIDKGKRTIEQYSIEKKEFGVITIITDTTLTPEETYLFYKKRIEIECIFDTMKNTLESDATYMQSEESIRGYFFITFIALYLYTQILNHLKKKNLNSKYSVKDILLHLSKIYKVTINNEEKDSEIPKKVKDILQKIDMPIT